jgi:hypothetical protein
MQYGRLKRREFITLRDGGPTRPPMPDFAPKGAKVELDVVSFNKAVFAQRLYEYRPPLRPGAAREQHPDYRQGLLRARRDWPCRRAAEQ